MSRLPLVATALALAACGPAVTTSGLGAPAPANHHLTAEEIAAIPSVFPTTYVPPEDPAYQAMYERMVELDNPGLVGQLVSTLLDLRGVEVPMVVKQCNDVGAYYDPNTRDITICYELMEYANDLAGRTGAERQLLDQDASATLLFAALHEIGHALVDVLDLSLHADEEHMADQLAFLFMTNTDDTALVAQIVAAPAAFFHHHGEAVERAGGHDPSDVHQPGAARAFVALCMLYGRHRDPVVGDALGADAAGCIEQTARVVDAWNDTLAPYTRLDTGRTFFEPSGL